MRRFPGPMSLLSGIIRMKNGLIIKNLLHCHTFSNIWPVLLRAPMLFLVPPPSLISNRERGSGNIMTGLEFESGTCTQSGIIFVLKLSCIWILPALFDVFLHLNLILQIVPQWTWKTKTAALPCTGPRSVATPQSASLWWRKVWLQTQKITWGECVHMTSAPQFTLKTETNYI